MKQPEDPLFKYRELNGWPTCWKGQHVSWWRRMIYFLYKKHVRVPFIPLNAKFSITRYPKVHKKEGIANIKIVWPNSINSDREHYVFSDFHEITMV